MADVAKLDFNGDVLDLPVVEGSEHEMGLDISRLRASTGLITLDEGYVNTGSTKSAITYLDGEQGVLRYRGYPIEQLAKCLPGSRLGGATGWHTAEHSLETTMLGADPKLIRSQAGRISSWSGHKLIRPQVYQITS